MSFFARRRVQLTEIPIVFTERKEGHSKMNRGIVFEALAVVWILKIKSIFGLL
jgi:dolichol-phosphate mannosyltransferase